jgi:hypothetical protein
MNIFQNCDIYGKKTFCREKHPGHSTRRLSHTDRYIPAQMRAVKQM